MLAIIRLLTAEVRTTSWFTSLLVMAASSRHDPGAVLNQRFGLAWTVPTRIIGI